MDWENEPATWKQIRYLKQHGHKPDRHLTKTAAAALIQTMGGQIPGNISVEESFAQQLPGQEACSLRKAVEQAVKTVGLARRETLHATEQALAIAISRRQLFWIDTCRDPTRMQAACGQVLDFYRRYGCRFEAPSHRQVEEVLSALDSAIPFWDRDHAELFFKTLELNYPELVKTR
jgi:hypothetical protein